MLAPEATVHQLGADKICRWVQEEVISQASQSVSQSVSACLRLSVLAEGQDWVGEGQPLVPFHQ